MSKKTHGGVGNVVSVTERAATRIAELIKTEGNEKLMLRLQVSGGGCAGFSYGFSLDSIVNNDDQIFERHGIKVIIDNASLGFLSGSEIDFVEDLMGSSFQVHNPNVSSTCGCGISFST